MRVKGKNMETKTIFLIDASTGCTCCRNENFTQGPYTDKAEAQAIIDRWSKGDCNPLGSQYAEYGRYTLEEHQAEVISGGRFIINDRVWGPDIEDKHV